MKNIIKGYLQRNNIKNISCDSRSVKAGDAFFAIRGLAFNGNDYIDEAIAKGASLVITDDISKAETNDKIKYVEDARLALGLAAEILYPGKPKHIMAVTGTNGKTSIVEYVRQIISKLGKACASLGTLGVKIEGHHNLQQEIDKIINPGMNLTSFDVITFYKILNLLAMNGIDYLIFEASSHGLDQNRIGSIKVESAGFTSFSQDHLDYHKDMESYLKAKLKLFANHLMPGSEAVIYSQIEYGNKIKDFFNEKQIKYSEVGEGGDIAIMNIDSDLYGQNIQLRYQDMLYEFQTDIIGSFQLINLLIAAKLVNNVGFEPERVIKALSSVKAAPGRLERATNINSAFQIFVDYAHTPDALKNALQELKKIKYHTSKLYVIFGCGGDRDKNKRSIMGQVASEIADYVVVTDDNPRTEDPAIIRKDILTHLRKDVYEIPDRELAIFETMQKLQSGDILLISGKGHEEYQIYGTSKKYFSDVETVKKYL